MLEIVPIWLDGYGSLVAPLAERLARTWNTEARVRQPWFDPERAFDPSRGQYNSTVLLRLLMDGARGPSSKVVGVAGVDLFIPILTYVFGEAQVGGAAAVVSLQRLRPELYGLPEDPALLLDRLEKEATHELGHTHGLLHCLDPQCVMHSSTYAEEIDLKPAVPCLACTRLVAAPAGARRAL